MDKQMRLSDAELEIIKNNFAEDDETLKLIRRVFYKGKITAQESTKLKQMFASDEIRHVLRKLFLPEIDHTIPLGQEVDLWLTVKVEENKDDLVNVFLARKDLIQLIEEGLEGCFSGKIVGKTPIETFDLNEKETNSSLYRKITSRNSLITHTEQVLIQIKMLAGLKSETTAQTIEKLKKNSSK